MACQVLKFPVRNAFHSQRSHDALAREPIDHAERIDAQVQGEVERLAGRVASGQRVQFGGARGGTLVMMPGEWRRPLGARVLAALVGAVLKLRRRS